MDRSVWLASTLWWLYLRHSSIPEANPMHPKHRAHTIWAFQHIFLATMSSTRPVGGSPRIENIAFTISTLFWKIQGNKRLGATDLGFLRLEISTMAPWMMLTNICFSCHAAAFSPEKDLIWWNQCLSTFPQFPRSSMWEVSQFAWTQGMFVLVFWALFF